MKINNREAQRREVSAMRTEFKIIKLIKRCRMKIINREAQRREVSAMRTEFKNIKLIKRCRMKIINKEAQRCGVLFSAPLRLPVNFK